MSCNNLAGRKNHHHGEFGVIVGSKIIILQIFQLLIEHYFSCNCIKFHYDDVIINAIASRITSVATVYLIVYSRADRRKHQSSASLAFVRGIHRISVNSPHKRPVTRKMVPFDDVIMLISVPSPRGSLTLQTKGAISWWRHQMLTGWFSPVDSPHKDQWRGALMFTLMCAWKSGRANSRDAGDLRRNGAHCDVIVM